MTNLRTCIVGGPGTGKTTLSASYVVPVFHTDDFKSLPWDDQKHEVAKWFRMPGPWVIEGVTIARALRYWTERYDHKPCDHLIILTDVHKPLSLGQRKLYDGTMTILNEEIPHLIRSGVIVEYK